MNEFECSDKLEKLNRKIDEINYKKKIVSFTYQTL